MRHETFADAPLSDETVAYLLATRGWARFPGVLTPGQVAALHADAGRVYQKRRALQVRNGVADGMEGASSHRPPTMATNAAAKTTPVA